MTFTTYWSDIAHGWHWECQACHLAGVKDTWRERVDPPTECPRCHGGATFAYKVLMNGPSYPPSHDLASSLPTEAPQDPAADRLTGAHVIRPRSHYVVAAVLVALALWGVILTVGWMVLA